ncbi:MAG: ABC transporter substrate-binding protein [Deltaproteobacteria bacterium]|nr:ABC transporter substrate-binding protein [Deltaproteobacteria bacterium]
MKNILCLFLIIAFLGAGAIAQAQQVGKVYRIGYLDPSTASATAGLLEAFRQELAKLGWIEGKNIIVEYRFAELKTERLPELAAELVRWKADIIVAAGGAPSAAKKVTSTIPIVVASGIDLVAAGLAHSLAKPGGNVTGLSILGPELITKRLEIIKEVVPKLTRVGVLMRSGGGVGTGQQQQMDEIRAAAKFLKLSLKELASDLDADALDRTFKTAVKERVGAIIPTAGRQTFGARKLIAQLAIKYRLPAIYQEKEFVEDGGLMSYGPDFSDLYRRAAIFVDKILKGRTPADLPVEQPMKFELVINLKTAKQIGLTIPQWTLMKADKVIR